ncbi:MAG: hypothetical protein KF823_14510 [Xanthomonadales bacterium]|nr:hypothetical protein [Xanthomonadales bacterium]
MQDLYTAAPPTLKFPAVVEVLPGNNPDHGQRCRLYHCDGCIDAWTWLDLDPATPPGLHWGFATTLDVGLVAEDVLLLSLHQGQDPTLSALLPESLCPIPGVLRRTTRLIDGLSHAALRDFLTRALLCRDALHGYWTSPASRRDHHAYPGGLAEHSLDVATMVATTAGLPSADRELGIAFGLLHDLGKIWCYTCSMHKPSDSRDHEALGRQRLQPALSVLCARSPRLGGLMRELLGGPRAPRPGSYPLAIGRVVRSFDQMSCEKTRTASADLKEVEDWDIPFQSTGTKGPPDPYLT